ncbi:MAG: THUMP domain-containing protein [Polyangia bacterium]
MAPGAVAPRALGPGQHRFFATCARGTEGALRREIASLRIAGARGDMGGVWFEGPLEMGFAVCLRSRVAMRVLLEVARFGANDADGLYAGARTVDWKSWMTARTTLAVSADVSDVPALRHSGFAALKVKDAVVDALRDALGARPNVDVRNPDVAIRLHVQKSEARLFLDLAGEPLHRRGYRVAMTEAPLKENLAAAVLLLGRVDPTLPFVDPMCGSGTLAIEHALAARRIAPGLGRRFGFQRWPLAQSEAVRATWDRLVAGARADILPQAPAPIVCAERFPDAVETARQNAAAAGVVRDLTFDVADVRDSKPQWPAGNLVTNPPYGERLMGDPAGTSPATAATPATASIHRPPAVRPDGQPAWQPAERDAYVQQLKLAGLYRGMSEAFERFHGWGIVILSGNPMWAQEMRRRAAISHRLFNGALEVRLLRYDVPAGGGGLPPPSSSRDGGRSGGGGGGRAGAARGGRPRRR